MEQSKWKATQTIVCKGKTGYIKSTIDQAHNSLETDYCILFEWKGWVFIF